MAYTFIENRLGLQPPINQVVSAASVAALFTAINLRPGARARAQDPTLGAGDFILLPTIASATTGSLVTYRESASGVYTTAMVPNTANLAQPLAVAMGTGAANNYGWFMLAGTVPIKKTAIKFSPNVAVYIGATTGRISSSAGAGKQVLAARASNSATVASATSTVTVTINYPHAQGQVT